MSIGSFEHASGTAWRGSDDYRADSALHPQVQEQYAAHFTSLSASLQEAAAALRQIVPPIASNGEGPVFRGAFGFSQGIPPTSVPLGGVLDVAAAHREAAKDTLVSASQSLEAENTELKKSYRDATAHLARLENEKRRFFDGAVVDFVHDVRERHGFVPRSNDDLTAQLRAMPGTDWAVPACRLQYPAVLPDEPQRSRSLGDENSELRRQLDLASRAGEALEREHRATEDRTYTLEREQARLRGQLSAVAVGDAPEDSIDSQQRRTQILERRLHDTEERAEALEIQNARLLAAVGMLDGGASILEELKRAGVSSTGKMPEAR